jgi:hypothetical protein
MGSHVLEFGALDMDYETTGDYQGAGNVTWLQAEVGPDDWLKPTGSSSGASAMKQVRSGGGGAGGWDMEGKQEGGRRAAAAAGEGVWPPRAALRRHSVPQREVKVQYLQRRVDLARRSSYSNDGDGAKNGMLSDMVRWRRELEREVAYKGELEAAFEGVARAALQDPVTRPRLLSLLQKHAESLMRVSASSAGAEGASKERKEVEAFVRAAAAAVGSEGSAALDAPVPTAAGATGQHQQGSTAWRLAAWGASLLRGRVLARGGAGGPVVSDWSCYRAAVDAFHRSPCGPLSQEYLHHLRLLVNLCNAGLTAAEAEGIVVRGVGATCPSVAAEASPSAAVSVSR